MSSFVSISQDIFARFPDTLLACVRASGIDNTVYPSTLKNFCSDTLRCAHEGLKDIPEIQGIPEVSCWRETYQAFGSKPSKYRSSIEALLRRAHKSPEPFFINPLVDLYNALSVKFRVPCGAEDLSQISGPLRLTFADGSEGGQVLGEDAPSSCEAGEVAYLDDLGFVCRRWNWREADRTKVTEATQDVIFICEAVRTEFHSRCEQAARDFMETGRAMFGGTWGMQLLTKSGQKTVD